MVNTRIELFSLESMGGFYAEVSLCVNGVQMVVLHRTRAYSDHRGASLEAGQWLDDFDAIPDATREINHG